MRRGDVYAHTTFPRQFVIVSADELSEHGTVIVVELAPAASPGVRGVLAVGLTEEDAVPDAGSVLAWRINYLAADRLGDYVGHLSAATMDAISMALRAALDL